MIEPTDEELDQQVDHPARRTKIYPNPDNDESDDGIGLLGGAPRW